MTKKQALSAVKQALKIAAFIEAKNGTCNCNFCKAARRLRKQLKPVQDYLERTTRR